MKSLVSKTTGFLAIVLMLLVAPSGVALANQGATSDAVPGQAIIKYLGTGEPSAKDLGVLSKSKMSKETSAATRDKMAKQPSAVQDKRMTARADAYKKSGASYLGKGISTYDDLMYSPKARSQRNDLSGSGRAKFDDYGYVSFTGGRTSQRAKDQAKRKKK